ncbi:MAG TPA: universal stress protein [Terracidiphilus sp.]|nr:universal stress protein [Terracidiphilus sp.]
MADAAVHDPVREWAHPAVILVATDLSDLDRLMPHALEQAAASGARLLLLHAMPSVAAVSADASGLPYYDPTGALQSADKALQHWCTLAHSRGIHCDALVREGQPIHEIGVAIRQFHADRVIVGTRSRGKLGKLLVGSVAEQVLRSVNLPVITVGPEAHLQVPGGRDPVVLLATTLREASRPGAALACRITAAQNAHLLLLHVLPPIDEMQRKHLPTGVDSAAMHELRRLAEETAANFGIVAEPLVAHGNPIIEILATASERHAKLIVLSATQRSAFENLTRDRTIYRVLAHARCPVLTLREPDTMVAEHHTETATAHHG